MLGRLVTPGNRPAPGPGLGRYFARELARMHGGDITVESKEGVGSTFTVSLPMVAERQNGTVRSVAD